MMYSAGVIGIATAVIVLLTINSKIAEAVDQSSYKVDFSKKFGIEDDLYSGFMPIKVQPEVNDEGSFFFWLAKKRGGDDNGKKKKLVIWLNGGPGCSSMVGMMWEHGPFTIGGTKGHYELSRNDNSWNEEAHMLYVEQPIRTGYSLAAKGARTITNEKEVGEDIYHFLQSFLTVFDDLKDAEIFVTGESYAGLYVPSIAAYIVRTQLGMTGPEDVPKGSLYLDLKGIAVGNGVIDDVIQVGSYAEYAYYHGLIPLQAKLKFEAQYARCMETEASNVKGYAPPKPECNMMGLVMAASGRPNEYNTATFNQYDMILSPDGAYQHFFNDPEIQEMLHVRGYDLPGINFQPESSAEPDSSSSTGSGKNFYAPILWESCNNDINPQMRGDHPQNDIPALQFLVDHVRVLLYSGEFDLNTNFLGTLHTLEAYRWGKKQKDWKNAERGLWRSQGDVAGEIFSLPDTKLSFLIIRNCGHLLPMDLPVQSRDMFNRFLNEESFFDVSLPSESSYLKDDSSDSVIADDDGGSDASKNNGVDDDLFFMQSSAPGSAQARYAMTVAFVLWAFLLVSLLIVGLRGIFKTTTVGSTDSKTGIHKYSALPTTSTASSDITMVGKLKESMTGNLNFQYQTVQD